MTQRQPKCPDCSVTVTVTKALPVPFQRCLGPGHGKPCPLNEILKTIEEERTRLESAQKSSLFIG